LGTLTLTENDFHPYWNILGLIPKKLHKISKQGALECFAMFTMLATASFGPPLP
jgi:hypothetical protein